MNREKEVKAYLEGKLSQAEKLKYSLKEQGEMTPEKSFGLY